MSVALELNKINKQKVGFFRFKDLNGQYLLTNDVGDYSFLNPQQFSSFLNGSVEKKYPDPIEKVNQIGGVLKTNKIALDTILNITESPWLDAPEGSFAYQLNQVSDILSLNNAKLAQDELGKLANRLEEANQNEQSEYYYQRACMEVLVGKHDEALELHKKAHLHLISFSS